jgi:hypothetical protein
MENSKQQIEKNNIRHEYSQLINNLFVFEKIFNSNRHFLLYERADLTASTLLQRIRGEIPQLHPLRLVSAATSTRE